MLPIVEAVRRRYPRARVSLAASEHARLLLPDDAVAVLTPSWLRRQTSPTVVRYRWLLSQRFVAALSGPALRKELGRFDLTMNLFRAWEGGMAFERDWTPQLPARSGAVHSLDFLAERLAAWDVALPPERRSPRLVVRPDARAWAASFWEREALTREPVVGLVPASNMAIKHWPMPSWAALNDALRERGARTLLFLPEAGHPASSLLALTSRPPIAVTADLARVAGILERCSLVVAVDTGLLHMAAAVGTPYVGLFGPTNPAVTGPYNRALGTCLVAPYSKGSRCRGCWKNFKYEDDRCRARGAESCAALLDAGAVLPAALDLLSRGAGSLPRPLPIERLEARMASPLPPKAGTTGVT
jgi:hypothetical protein